VRQDLQRTPGPAWLLLVVVGVLAGALYSIDWVEVTEDRGFAAEARRNPFLAAERFLARLGVVVDRTEGLTALDTLPPVDETLLLASARRALSDRRIDDLLDWVRRGGRLVIAADGVAADADGAADPLFAALDIALFEDQPDATSLGGMREQRLPELPASGCATTGGLTLVDLPGEAEPLVLGTYTRRYLAYLGDGAARAYTSEVGPQMLVLTLGAGEVVALTSLSLWRNERIGCADHAHLLRWLSGARGRLSWLANTEIGSLPVLLWRQFPVGILLGVALLVLWAWRQAFRVTGPRAEPPADRRALMEHVEGVARFRWRQGDWQALLEPLRDEVRAGVPLTTREDARLTLLAERCGVPAGRLRRALFDDVGADARGFEDAVSVLQAARLERLAAGGMDERPDEH